MIRALKVPYEEFFVHKHFPLTRQELLEFLLPMRGYISDDGEVFLDPIDIETTINFHQGDARIFFKDDCGYQWFHADTIFMEVDINSEFCSDIMEWIEENIPSLHAKFAALKKQTT